MRIFLTGATGYIGKALCLRLRAAGHELRALVRATSRTETLTGIGVATFVGDLADRASMREGMSGADWVVHAAAELDLEAAAGRMERANVEGSENVASLAAKLGVPRFLSISSIARWGGSPDDGTPATEQTPQRLPLPTRYSRTKAAGEEAIRAWAKRGLAVNTVFPSLVYGPPGKKSGSNALLRQLYLGRFPAMIGADRKSSWIFLDDLVEGLVRVLDRSAPGRDYLMTGDVATTREIAGRVAALGGAPVPRLELPLGVARLGLRLARPFYRLRGRRTPVPIEQIASLERHWAFDDARARAEFDWHPRPLAEGLPVTLDHLRSAR